MAEKKSLLDMLVQWVNEGRHRTWMMAQSGDVVRITLKCGFVEDDIAWFQTTGPANMTLDGKAISELRLAMERVGRRAE